MIRSHITTHKTTVKKSKKGVQVFTGELSG
jgi:hypothetical protein